MGRSPGPTPGDRHDGSEVLRNTRPMHRKPNAIVVRVEAARATSGDVATSCIQSPPSLSTLL